MAKLQTSVTTLRKNELNALGSTGAPQNALEFQYLIKEYWWDTQGIGGVTGSTGDNLSIYIDGLRGAIRDILEQEGYIIT